MTVMLSYQIWSGKPSLATWGNYIHKSAKRVPILGIVPSSKREKRELSAIIAPMCVIAYRKTDVYVRV